MSKLTAEPLHARIIVERFEPETETEGGIKLPDIAQQQNSWATVIAIGPDVTAVNEGDDVVVSLYGGMPVVLEKKEYLVIDEKELLLRVPLRKKLSSK